MRKLDIGSGRANFEDYETLDKNGKALGCTHQANLDYNETSGFEPFWLAHKNTYDEVRAFHVLEHVKPENRLLAMRNLYLVLKPKGILKIEVPIAGTQQFWQDPTHLSGWIPETFWYFTKGNKFGEAFAKREQNVPLFEFVSDKLEGWRYNIVLKKQ